MIFRKHAPKFKYTPPVFCYCMHHTHFMSLFVQKICIKVILANLPLVQLAEMRVGLGRMSNNIH